MDLDRAQALALNALGFLTEDERAMESFLALSGAAPATLAQRATDPEFLGGVLDFLLQDEVRLLAFCEAAGVAPQMPARARAVLGGGTDVGP